MNFQFSKKWLAVVSALSVTSMALVGCGEGIFFNNNLRVANTLLDFVLGANASPNLSLLVDGWQTSCPDVNR